MRIAVILCATMMVAACGSTGAGSEGATYHADATQSCLEQAAGVTVTPAPDSELGQFPGATDALTVNWSLSKHTPPAAVVVLFADSAENRDAMEHALDQFAEQQAHVSLTGYLQHDRNASWAWIAPHGHAEERALRRCLEQSL